MELHTFKVTFSDENYWQDYKETVCFICYTKKEAKQAFLDYIQCDTVVQAKEEGIIIIKIISID